MSDNLKPCPFCGAPAELIHCSWYGFAKCIQCGCKTSDISANDVADLKRRITEAWNLRALSPEPARFAFVDQGDGTSRLEPASKCKCGLMRLDALHCGSAFNPMPEASAYCGNALGKRLGLCMHGIACHTKGANNEA